MAFGSGDYQYEVIDLWAKRPKGSVFIDVVGSAIDEEDNVYVFSRGTRPVMVFDREGNFKNAWGDGVFARAHGVTIGPDGLLYCTDDRDNTVRKFTKEGVLLRTWGTPYQYSDTGYTGGNYTSIKRGAGPFNRPTKVAFGPGGEMYVSDGYGNAQVHKFSPEGEYLFSWGGPGDGPGEFRLPHAVSADSQGRVYVPDRYNNRVQIFSPEGEFITEWTDLKLPNDVDFDADGKTVYVAELSHRVSILDMEGNVLARWGTDEPCMDAGYFVAPHSISVDSQGSLYVGEVCETNSSMDKGGRALQKFVRI